MKRVFSFLIFISSLGMIAGCGDVTSTPPPPPRLVISPATAPAGTMGFAYSMTLNASGGQAPYSWSVNTGALPTGLSLNANTGVISGVPSSSGTSDFTMQVTDSSTPSRTGNASFALVVNPQLSFSITSLPDGVVGVAYNAIASVSGGTAPFTWTVASGGLPPGLTLTSATGAIAGTPTTAGGFGFGLKVTDSSTPSQTAKFFGGINIYPLLAITSTSLPDGVVGSAYSTTLTASGGTGSYTWSISSGSLPGGISLDPSTGILSGTPASAEQVSFTAQVTDTANPAQTATLPLTLNVAAPGANNRLMKGSYAFLLQGFDSEGAVAIVGSIDADGTGAITGGTLDINGSGGVQQDVAIQSGTYEINSDRRGSVTIQSALGSQSFRLAINADGTLAHFIEFDAAHPDSIRGNGVMKRRDPGVLVRTEWNGNYAFAFSGPKATGGRSAVLGSFSANAAGGLDSGLADINSDGVAVQEAPISNGSGYSFGSNGRGTLMLVIDGSENISGAVYAVSAREFFFVRTDGPGVELLSGEIMQQSAGTSLVSVFAGPSVLHLEGGSPAGSSVAMAVIDSRNPGVLSGTFDVDEGGSIRSTSVSGGSYAVTSDAFGRSVMSFAGEDFVLYSIDAATAFVTDASGKRVKTGMLERQSAGTSSSAFPIGEFVEGSESNTNSRIAFESGALSITSGGDLSEIADLDFVGETPLAGYFVVERLSSPGEGRIATSRGAVFYVISPTQMIRADMQKGEANPRLVFVEQ